MNNWRLDNPRAFRDQVDCSYSQITSLGKVKRTGECFSWYGCNDLRAKIEPTSWRPYKPGDFLAVRPLNWDEIMNEDDDNDRWADPGAPSSGRSRTSHGNDNEDSAGEEDTQGSEKRTGKGKGTMDGKGRAKGNANEEGKGKGKGNGKGKGIVTQTPVGDDISLAVGVQLQNEMYKADSDTEGFPEPVYLELEASPAMSISSEDDTNSTESDGQYYSELIPDVDMRMQEDVDAPDGVDLDGDVDMGREGNDDEDKDKETEDEEVVQEEDEDKEQDQDEDDGKEPQTLGQREMVNTSADDVDTMVDDLLIVLPEQGQVMPEHTPLPQTPVPSPPSQTLEPHRRPQTPETPLLSGLARFGLGMAQKPHPAVPTQREAEAAGNTFDGDVDVDVAKQLLIESAGGDSLPDVTLPAPRPDGSVGEELTSPRLADEAMVVAFRLASGSCLSCSFLLF